MAPRTKLLGYNGRTLLDAGLPASGSGFLLKNELHYEFGATDNAFVTGSLVAKPRFRLSSTKCVRLQIC